MLVTSDPADTGGHTSLADSRAGSATTVQPQCLLWKRPILSVSQCLCGGASLDELLRTSQVFESGKGRGIRGTRGPIAHASAIIRACGARDSERRSSWQCPRMSRWPIVHVRVIWDRARHVSARPAQRHYGRRRRSRRTGDDRRGRHGPHRRHRRPAARRQPVSGESPGRGVRRQRVRQARRVDAGQRARHDRVADRADQHAVGRHGRRGGRPLDARAAGQRQVRSVNALVGETNDGTLNDIRGLHVTREHVAAAVTRASDGPVEEGAVGAGTGTVAFGWKGGIGTSSRRIRGQGDTWTVGVLVQTNFGGRLSSTACRSGRRCCRKDGRAPARPPGATRRPPTAPA